MQIAISGPAAAGKGTISRAFARRYGFVYVDIGLVFRAMAYVIQQDQGISCVEAAAMIISGGIKYSWEDGCANIFYEDRVITSELADSAVAEATSHMAVNPAFCRAAVQGAEHLLGKHERLVADGRSAGTALLPDADLKFYVDAAVAVRAKRRFEDLRARGFAVTMPVISESLRLRDERDRQRPFDPLRVPSGAILLDTTHCAVEEVVLLMWSIARTRFRI